jgi:hypothetical protein
VSYNYGVSGIRGRRVRVRDRGRDTGITKLKVARVIRGEFRVFHSGCSVCSSRSIFGPSMGSNNMTDFRPSSKVNECLIYYGVSGIWGRGVTVRDWGRGYKNN